MPTKRLLPLAPWAHMGSVLTLALLLVDMTDTWYLLSQSVRTLLLCMASKEGCRVWSPVDLGMASADSQC